MKKKQSGALIPHEQRVPRSARWGCRRVKRRAFLRALAGGAAACAGIQTASMAGHPLLSEAFAFWDAGRADAEARVERPTRWAMAIYLEKLAAEPALPRRIVEACHRPHNVPDIPHEEGEPDQTIRWIWPEPFDAAFYGSNVEGVRQELRQRSCLVACNHCDNPPCARVCPTGATYKGDGGLVMMDYHRCIGCRYCMVACPYGARSFNFQNPRPHIERMNTAYPTRMRGVVEKCSFCVERLAEGLAPYCVEASGGALVFGNVNDPDSDVSRALQGKTVLVRKASLGTGPQIYYILD